MKRFTMLFGLVLLLLLASAFIPSAVEATVPSLINFQGMLKDGSGNPVADASYSVTFSIYETPTGGTPLWTETQSVSTTDGLFAVFLGASNPIPDTAFKSSERFLGIAISPDGEMPRQQLVSVGYAYRVNSVDSSLGGNIKTKLSIGPGHTNTGTEAFVAGANNVARGNYSVVSGGGGPTAADSNSASGIWSTVSGGFRNIANARDAAVGGGESNTAGAIEATVGGGFFNTASGVSATIGGGNSNIAGGQRATIGGGVFNRARGDYSVVGGGGGPTLSDSNSASGIWSTVSGGFRNIANARDAAVGGGESNTAGAIEATVGGGFFNTASGVSATIGGGNSNIASGSRATVGGGEGNAAIITHATVGGGAVNTASGLQATIGGGSYNTASNSFATVGGGSTNVASGNAATVGGGIYDTANGTDATVPGGLANKASGDYSFAAGRRAKAIHSGAFVWGDNTDADFASTGVNQFLIRASGGVGIGTNSPARVLDISSPTSMEIVTRRSASPVDERVWRLFNSGSALSFEAMNDALSGGTSVMSLFRDGTTCNLTGTWSVCSDRRLKKEIEPLRNALETVTQLEPVSFRWKDGKKDAQFGRVRGLIAQDVEKVIPEWIKTDPDGYKRIEPIGVDALLIEAIKELKAENAGLKDELSDLREQVQKLLAKEKEKEDKKLGQLR